MKSSPSIYELKITLRGTRPPIWRRLRVRSDVTLFKFHSILQPVMGWMDGHLHQFMAKNKVYGAVDLELLPFTRRNCRVLHPHEPAEDRISTAIGRGNEFSSSVCE